MWEQFNQLLLMAEGGKTAFFGAAADAEKYAQATLDTRCPSGLSAAEWLIDCVSTDVDTRDALLAAHAAVPVPADPDTGRIVTIRPRPSFLRTTGALLVRNFANTRRREMKKLEWILTVGLSVIFAGVFTGVGAEKLQRQKDYISSARATLKGLDRSTVLSIVTAKMPSALSPVTAMPAALLPMIRPAHPSIPRRLTRPLSQNPNLAPIAVLFFFVAHWSFLPVFKAIGAYPRQRDVLTRERAGDSYPIGAWMVANILGEWMVAWGHPLVFYIITWPIAAMPLSRAPALYCITMLNYEVFTALGNLCAALVFDSDRARVITTVVMVFMMLAGGFFVNLADPRLPAWLSSLHHLSFQGYTFGLYVRNALTVDEYEAFATTISRYSFSKLPTPVNVCVLGGIATAMRFLGYLVVLRSKALKFS